VLRLKVSRDQPPDRHILEQVFHTMQRGGVVAFATETVYGLSVDPRDSSALERLVQLKHRPRSRQFPFVAADLAQAEQLARIEGPVAAQLVGRFWPGPLTLVLPLKSPHPLAAWDWGSTIGIRVPRSALVRGLAAHLGIPIPATSANLSGESAASDPAQFAAALVESIDLLLDSGRLPESSPSTVLSLAGSRPEILRPGAVSQAELAPFLSRTETPPAAIVE
jgi:L-threonylcarbamoyladenylate synthase